MQIVNKQELKLNKLLVSLILVLGLSACATQQTANQRGPAIWKIYKEECTGGSYFKAAMACQMGANELCIHEQQKISGTSPSCQNITRYMIDNRIPFPPKN